MSELLSAGLAQQLPGRLLQRAMAPELAYGRHHGPAFATTRQAAVLLLVMPSEAGWSVPALLRPAHMKAHAGQVSLPGGMVEPGETPEAAALREFEEELGAATGGVQILGRLSPVFVFVTNVQVTPIVAIVDRPLAFAPSPDEVAEVVELRLSELTRPECRTSDIIRRRGLSFRAPHYQIGRHRVWGATSLILAEFLALLARSTNGPA
jgi:8-oxo-dGTP pyrophosphatase MutT (NUDIX family)